MTKYAYRLPPCAPYDIPAMQLWLESMAARGLHLAQDGFFCGIASFEIGTPRNEKFRLEATTTNGGLLSEEYSPEEEALQLCRQMGWTYRARRGQFHIYSSADPNAPELHTDPRIQAMTIGVLGKHLNREEGRSFDAYLTVQFHRTRWAWVADRLAGEFLSQAGGSLLNQTADRIFGQEPVTETELDLPGADYCAYYYSDLHDPYIILRQGEIVLHIRLSPLGDGVALEPEEIA